MAAALLVLLAGTACGSGQAPAAGCSAALPGRTAMLLDLEQAQNAATIAAVGKRMGMPDHAVTVALVTALQESKLHNLAYGDRDSVGLFQQRPSQGWGSVDRILEPRLSAAAFYARLRTVPNWAELPVTEAAQAVQRSAFPLAYAQWEGQARVLASALTGEVPAGLACTLVEPVAPAGAAAVAARAALELGVGALATQAERPSWAAASWLVAHAADLGVQEVAVRGRRWTAASGQWSAYAAAGAVIRFA
jgi:hypothetical protein